MVGADMSLKGLVFSEGLVAGRVSCAPEAIVALMCFFVSSETCCG
jgi:hypothetical protein